MIFDALLFIISFLAAAVASIAGFGIGSLVTPFLSVSIGAKLAIVIVSLPHFVATAQRFLMLKSHVDREIFFSFGVMSIMGGLLGALLHGYLATPSITFVFGGILIFAGVMGLTGFAKKMNFRGPWAYGAGGLSSFLGGMVGNQGGIRSAALLGANISKESFVATATATGLVVDLVRIPVYLWNEGAVVSDNLYTVVISTLGVIAGTYWGAQLLKRFPEETFRRIVSGFIFLLGLFMIYQGLII